MAEASSVHCTSRNAAHIDTQAMPFSSAKARTSAASASVKVSPATSLTPSIEVSAMPRQASASDVPKTFFSWVCAAFAEARA